MAPRISITSRSLKLSDCVADETHLIELFYVLQIESSVLKQPDTFRNTHTQ